MTSLRRWCARIALAALAAGALFALWVIKGENQRIWPFPRQARILPGILEVLAWIVVGVTAVFLLCWLVIALWEEATSEGSS